MTQKQKIEQLEKEVVELKMKVALLEARPMIITVTPQPTYVPNVQPWSPSYPYIGDPVYPSISGGTSVSPLTVGNEAGPGSQRNQNVCSATVSSQRSSLI